MQWGIPYVSIIDAADTEKAEMKSLRKRRRFQKAFTIIEILIAIMVISIALLGTVAAIAFGLRASDQGADNTTATQINRKVMELLMQSIISPDVATLLHAPGQIDAARGAAPWRPIFNEPQQPNWFGLKDFGYVIGSADATRFIRDTRNYELDVSSERVPNGSNDYSVNGRFYRLTVTTRWQATSGVNRWKFVQTSAYSIAGAD